MRVASQIWQVVFASQTLQVFCLALRKKAQYVVVNVVFKNQLQLVKGDALLQVMEGFKDLLGLLGIQGAIDVAQIHIRKPRVQAYVEEYYSYKSKAYSMQLQGIVDHKK
jgi:hypothetical protein